MVIFVLLLRTPSVRISRRIIVPTSSISESTGVLNLATPNGQASGNLSLNSEAAELKKFETNVFPPSPPTDESVLSDTVDAASPSIVNHVGHDSGPPKDTVRDFFSAMFLEANFGFCEMGQVRRSYYTVRIAGDFTRLLSTGS